MSTLNQHHSQLDDMGFGKCSVPMWSGGCPSGFCDKPAFGVPPHSPMRMNYCSGQMNREDMRYAGHVPALACPGHGGPRSRVFADGDAYCAVFPDFINIQESICAFAETPEAARAALATLTGRTTT